MWGKNRCSGTTRTLDLVFAQAQAEQENKNEKGSSAPKKADDRYTRTSKLFQQKLK